MPRCPPRDTSHISAAPGLFSNFCHTVAELANVSNILSKLLHVRMRAHAVAVDAAGIIATCSTVQDEAVLGYAGRRNPQTHYRS